MHTDHTPTDEAAHSFTRLLDHLAILTRNRMHVTDCDDENTFDLVATPTPIQRRAFELFGQPIPQKLK